MNYKQRQKEINEIMKEHDWATSNQHAYKKQVYAMMSRAYKKGMEEARVEIIEAVKEILWPYTDCVKYDLDGKATHEDIDSIILVKIDKLKGGKQT